MSDYGALEAVDFEPLRAVSEWLIETPDEGLIELIRQKPQTGLVYTYRL